MAAIASASAVRPCVQGLSCRRPATARAAPKAVRCTAQLEQQKQRQQAVAAASAVSVVALAAAAPAAQAATEMMQLAEGEPFIVNIGWAMLAASFSFSLAAVVWGRSGM
ncbi:g5169 [Coccomyxa viridis]|uniref:Cytochrome b6-f complex subunit PetN n=1 Tax=Coccomyxa viridis TaxID=1274662 RepID=A0ABP1FS51_9CHLO